MGGMGGEYGGVRSGVLTERRGGKTAERGPRLSGLHGGGRASAWRRSGKERVRGGENRLSSSLRGKKGGTATARQNADGEESAGAGQREAAGGRER